MTVKSSAFSNHNITTTTGSDSSASGGPSATAVKATRPKPVSQWTVPDVQKWLRRHCGDYYHLYGEKFLEQDITGRSLVRLTENSLLRLEIVNPEHRQAILREISKLRLRTNILLLKDMERRQSLLQKQLEQATEEEVH